MNNLLISKKGIPYKIYDNTKYLESFPDEWIFNEIHPSLKNCKTCLFHGKLDDIFIGYCVPCAEKYNGTRGRGFYYPGELAVFNTMYKTNKIGKENEKYIEKYSSEIINARNNEIGDEKEGPSHFDGDPWLSGTKSDNEESDDERYY
jgi:hypothetical protein